jgi:hypothetical protein
MDDDDDDPPDFLLVLVLVASANFMRVSLLKAALRGRKSGYASVPRRAGAGGMTIASEALSKNISRKGPRNCRSLGFPGFPVESCGFAQLHVVLFRENHICGRGESGEVGNSAALGACHFFDLFVFSAYPTSCISPTRQAVILSEAPHRFVE